MKSSMIRRSAEVLIAATCTTSLIVPPMTGPSTAYAEDQSVQTLCPVDPPPGSYPGWKVVTTYRTPDRDRNCDDCLADASTYSRLGVPAFCRDHYIEGTGRWNVWLRIPLNAAAV